ncbi:MAG TPA: hypothetical protein VF692_05490 [Pyrinomonadaceae bacterium]|jgi:hypothetical protein
MQIVFDGIEVEKIHEMLERELADLRADIRRAGEADNKMRLAEEETLLMILHKKFAVAALFAPRAVE